MKPRKTMQRSMDLIRWLLPGLGVKRWLIVALAGAILLVNGASRWFTEEGSNFGVNEFVDTVTSDFINPSYLSYIFIVLGVLW